VFNNNNDLIQPDDVTLTDANNLDVDISGFGTITGTWRAVVLSSGSGLISTASDLSLAGQVAGDTLEFDGTNWVAVSRSERMFIGSFSRDMTLASGTQAVTGVGFQPNAVIMLSAKTTPDSSSSTGIATSTASRALFNDHNALAERYNVDDDDSIRLVLSASDRYEGNILSMDSSGFTIDWLKTGTPTTTALVRFLAIR
jgi:hypothetical protein